MVTISFGQSIFENPITGTNPNTSNPFVNGQLINPNITVTGIGRGSGITGSNANDRFSANGWNTVSFDSSKYFEFTLTPNSGFQINFASFVYTGQASGTGATNFAFRSSVDGFISNIGTPNVSSTTIPLTAGTYQNIATAVTFRFYGWGASAGGGTFSINDFIFNGTVVSACAPPVNPAGTISVTSSCGSSSLTYSLHSATTYWQTSATGTAIISPTTSPLVVSTSGTYYVRTFNGTCWSAGTVSQTVTIINPVVITTQPTNQSTTTGATASFTVVASNAVSYQWQVSTNGGSSWSNVGTNATSYTTPSAVLAMNGYQYRVIVLGIAPCSSTISSVATLSVTSGPCLSESFTGITFPSAGWLQTGVLRSTSATDYNTGPAAASFGSNNCDLTTTMVSNPTELRFYLGRSSNSTNKTFTVEVSTTSQTSGFTSVATYNHSNVSSNSYNQYIVNLSTYTSSSSVWIRFVKTSSTTSPWRLDDVNIFCGTPCTPAIIASITPNNGPVGTQVIITASSGDLSGAMATFNGISASVISSSAAQLIVTVPNGATIGTDNFVITDGQPCNSSATFTVNEKSGSCGSLSSLIMTEIYDNPSGSLGYIEVYNGTSATIDLTTYYIRRYGSNTDFIANNFTDFTFAPSITTIAPGAVVYGRISSDANITTPNFDYGNSSGINGDDILHLYNGTTLLDVYVVPNNISGYTAIRNTTTSGSNTTSNPSDWTHTNTASTADLGLFPFVSSGATPTVSTQPVSVSICSNEATFSVTASTSGVGTLTYQWYYNNGTATNWTTVNGTSFTGVTTSDFVSNTLNLSGSIDSLNDYQFYCLVTQDGSCNVFSNAAQLKIDGTTWNGTIWSNGLPSLTKLAIINGNYNTTPNGSFECCSLVVNTGFTLNIQSNDYVLIENNLTVNETLNVLDNGSLVQVNNGGVNIGNIIYERTTSGNALDYVYWSTPVNSHVLGASNHYFRWNPTVANTNGGFGNWINCSGATMSSGEGYILRDVFAANFNGIPNNGIVNVPISRGNYTGANYSGTNGIIINNLSDNLNLIGNPYPSAINSMSFLTANTNVEGAVRIWTHGTSPSAANSNPFYGSYQQNYSNNDYIIHNGMGTTIGPIGFNGNIAGAQAFFVVMNDGAASTENVVFNNSMRNKTYDNSQFYRTNQFNNILSEEKSRIWLDFNASNQSSKILVGYVEGATMGKDRMFDAVSLESSSANIYSLIDSKKMAIQGRYPFDENDSVPLGIKITQIGNNTIGINAVDGIFNNQNIYLEDLYLGITHNLTVSPYNFSSTIGVFNDRFKIVYKNGMLATPNFVNENAVLVYTNENTISIKSSEEVVKSVVVFDVLSRTLFIKDNINEKTYLINTVQPNNQALFFKITLTNGQVVNKKIVY